MFSNPSLLFRYLWSRRKMKRTWPEGAVEKEINGLLFTFDFSLGHAIWEMYNDGYEVDTCTAMSKILQPNDTYIDIGSNIGYVAMIAAGLVGQSGHVHCFEPVPQYYERLQEMANRNASFSFILNQSAAGSKRGTVTIDVSGIQNVGWNTMVPGFMRDDMRKERIDIDVIRLDEYISEHHISDIKLIKIDTEGYEFHVLQGLRGYFESSSQHRPDIVCEMVPDAISLIGHRMEDLTSYLSEFGYQAYSLTNMRKRVKLENIFVTTNVLLRAKRT